MRYTTKRSVVLHIINFPLSRLPIPHVTWCSKTIFGVKPLIPFQLIVFRKTTEQQRWSRGHKARGQGQGHKKNPRPRPRPRTAFPRTDTLEAKDRNARGQGQGPRTQSASALQKKKKKKGLHKNFSSDLH